MLNMVTANSDEIHAFVAEADRLVKTYGWVDEIVHPHGYAVKIVKIIDDLRDYDICSDGSKDYLVDLANGLARVLNKWEAYELSPKVQVRLVENGNVFTVDKEWADDMIKAGICVAV